MLDTTRLCGLGKVHLCCLFPGQPVTSHQHVACGPCSHVNATGSMRCSKTLSVGQNMALKQISKTGEVLIGFQFMMSHPFLINPREVEGQSSNRPVMALES